MPISHSSIARRTALHLRQQGASGPRCGLKMPALAVSDQQVPRS